MYTTSLRGLGIMAQPPQVMVSVPQPYPDPPTQMPTAETSLANAAYQDATDYTQFTQASNYPEYNSPAAYTANLIAYAQTLCYGSWAPYTCKTNAGGAFDPTAMGTQYANAVFASLKATPYGASGSVYDYWIAHPPSTDSNYTPPAQIQPYNPANVPGSSALPPPPNVLTNVAPTPITTPVTNPTNALNPPVQNWFPVNPQAIANGTTGGSVLGLPDLSSATTWLQSNWMILAAGVAAVVILPSLLGGKR